MALLKWGTLDRENHRMEWYNDAMVSLNRISSFRWFQSFSPLSSSFTSWFLGSATNYWLGKWHFLIWEWSCRYSRYTRFTRGIRHSLISHQPIFLLVGHANNGLMPSFRTFLGKSWNAGAMTFVGQNLSLLVWAPSAHVWAGWGKKQRHWLATFAIDSRGALSHQVYLPA